MAATSLVRDIMSTDVLSFRPDDDVKSAMHALVDRDLDGGPVVDESGAVVGMLTTGDLIVRESSLHFPTLISLFGASIELKSKGFDEDVEKALGSFVRELMSHPAVVCSSSATIVDAATLMHDHSVSRLAVVDDGALVGIVSRGDIIKGMLGGD